MKTTKKTLLLVGCAVLLVVASVMGTLAWMTSTASVSNTFTVGNVSITLDESKVTANGVKDGEDRVTSGNRYKLVPGHSYVKDPVIHVGAASEDCYLFVKIENAVSALEDPNNSVAKQMTDLGWVAVTGQDNIYAYYGKNDSAVNESITAQSASANVTVFERFVVKADADLSTVGESATLTITAYAIQSQGLEDKTAAEIWTAGGFDTTP